jgi:hypothetical protein
MYIQILFVVAFMLILLLNKLRKSIIEIKQCVLTRFYASDSG